MTISNQLLSEITIFENNCPTCNKRRIYKTKQGLKEANKLNRSCKSCSNSIVLGGEGSIFKNNKKLCSSCKEYKELSQYFKYSNRYHSCCKSCSSIKSNLYHKSVYRYSRYGIEESIYLKILNDQEKKCAICKMKVKNFHIDHDHKTNKVRGLLCGNCNKALGLFKENTNTMNNAIIYINKYDYK